MLRLSSEEFGGGEGLPVLSILRLSIPIRRLYHGNVFISCASDWFHGVLFDWAGLVALILQDLIGQI